MLNIGVIGLGQMGRLHLYNCFHFKDVRVIAVADKSEKLLRKAETHGVKKLYKDYGELLANQKNLDAVIISLPNFLHLDSVRMALESGLHVLIEKPLARNVGECQQIVNYVKKSGRRLMVGHCWRWLDAIEKMKQEVDSGHIGRQEVITAEMILNGPFSDGVVPTPVPDWWFDPEKTGGGVLLDLGYHLIDLFRFFAGEASVDFSRLSYSLNLPVEDGAIVVLNSQNSDLKGIINVGWYQKSVFPHFNFRFIVHGNAGFTSTDHFVPKNPYIHAVKEGIKNLLRRAIAIDIKPLSYTYYYEEYVKELQSFFDCIKKDEEPLVTEIDGLRTVELVSQAYAKACAKRK
jgi:myo-inositol 2-dehydrogenase/D-chiro-inositol 1-dehydrogenase